MSKESRSVAPSDVVPFGADHFATTRWSMVVSAGGRSSPAARKALETLCESYWYPLYAFARRQVASVGEAQDATQSFFAELLKKNYVGSARSERGRFRAFLIAAFKHFLSKERAKARANKRGGGRIAISLNFDAADLKMDIEPASGLTAEELYDRQWAIALLDETMSRLQTEFEQSGKGDLFRELKCYAIGDHGDHGGATYADVGKKLGLSEGAAKMAASRLRRRYRELLREAISQTVSGRDEVDEEICELFAALAISPSGKK